MKLSRVLTLLVLIFLVSTATTYAQLSLGGTPQSFSQNVKSTVPRVVMPTVDVAELLAEDAEEAKLGVPMRFGFPFDVQYDLLNSGVWETLPNGWRVWRLEIEAPGAKSINLLYDNFWLPDGAEFYIYSEDRQHQIGAFSSQNNKDHREFATSLVKGEVSILELNIPPNVSHPGEISISRVVHGYRDVLNLGFEKDFGSSGSCNNNVNCPEGDDWQDQKRSVAMILSSGGFRLCTGSMVNNVRQDLTPYFLTADHCLGGESTWIIMFNYESPTCSNIDGPTWMTVQGTTLLASNSFSDFGLLELTEAPPDSYNVYYAGWNAIDTTFYDSVVAIHHPSGDIKKISFDYDPVTVTSYLGEPVPGNGSHWRIGQWEDGTTEPGSSGSPIFNRSKQIIGQLHGGYASCASITSDWYGRVNISWDNGGSASSRLMDWLDPDGTGILAIDGRDGAGIKITHTPLEDTRDSLNPYDVIATIQSNVALYTDSLFLYYDVGGGYVENLLTATGTPDEFASSIPAQSPGTVIDYYLLAVDTEGKADTTDVYSFRVVDYGLALNPEYDSKTGPVDDTVLYLMSVSNDGLFADDYTLSLTNNLWSTTIWDETLTTQLSSTGTMNSDDTLNFYVRVIVPSSLYGDTDSVAVTATSTGDGSYSATSGLVTISDGEPFAIPFTDDFPTTTVDVGKWVLNNGAESNDIGLSEPSAPYSLNLNGNPDGADTVMSQAIDLSGETNVIVTYFYEQTGAGDSPEAGDDLFVEYIDSAGAWVTLNQHLGSGPDETEYTEVSEQLPGEALHSGFRLRLRSTGTAGAFDDWFVDDIFVGNPPAYEVSISPSFASGFANAGDTAVFNTYIVNSGLNDDTYDLSVSNNTWDVSFFDEFDSPITQTSLVPSNDSGLVVIKVAVPGSALMAELDSATVTATSQGDNLVSASGVVESNSNGTDSNFPWFEPFPADSMVSFRWSGMAGAVVSTDGLNEPSEPYSLNLDGSVDTATTATLDLSGQTGVILSYYYQAGGGGDIPEAGDDLVIEYKNDIGVWTNLHSHTGGSLMTNFEYVSIGVPTDGYYNGFQIRFLTTGNSANADDWFVDDIRIDFAPTMSYNNESLTQTLQVDDTTHAQMTIDNGGPGGLNYSINIIPVLANTEKFVELLKLGEVEPARRAYPDGFDTNYQDIKGSDDTRQGFRVDKDAGGPDAYGYFWVDSDEPGGPAFDWSDVSGSGTDVVADLDDDNYGGPYDIGFAFPYYGDNYTEIYIGSNGIIGFAPDGMNSRFKVSIPTAGTPNNMLAWLWDDLNPDDTDNESHVYIDTTGGVCVIQFTDYSEYSALAGDVVNAQVILEPNGTITYQYLSIGSGFDITANTVGIENADGTDGLEVSYLSSYLHDSLSIQFTSPYLWLTCDKTSGDLLTGESDTIQFEFTTGDLDTGVYEANVVITSNDPNNNPISIPAELTVTDIPDYICGDIDNSGAAPDIADLVYFVDYSFGDPSGPAPPVPEAADVNNDNDLNIADIVYLVDYMFGEPNGPAPNCG